ncbi:MULTISPECIES: recombinase family protein [Bhargavaea]|uniref:Recombinase family protein n=1 Tax=Bhargavaea changchunensis TaxID=2134037 RepID=A0ABW2NLQ1_9BACL|nr:recombinase family protein [Bhargavaea sp. CC-171006]
MNYAYIRCLPSDRDMAAQKETLGTHPIDEWVREEEYQINEALDALLERLEAGDVIYVHSLAALAHSPAHLMAVLEQVSEKKAVIRFHREEIDSEQPLSLNLEQMVRMFTEFQSETVSLATKTGIDRAREKGVSTGRPRKKDKNVREALRMYRSNLYTLAEIREKTNISKTTLYRYLALEKDGDE